MVSAGMDVSAFPLLWGMMGVVWLTLINLAAVLGFHHDKRMAITGGWRIPENTLLLIALLGGAPGAKAAQWRFRHKTRKQPFRGLLDTIVVLQAVGVLLLLSPRARDVSLRAVDALLHLP